MPLLWLSLAALTGIILANLLPLTTATWLVLAGVFLLLALVRFILKRSKTPHLNFEHKIFNLYIPIPIPILFIALCLGGARYQAELPDLTDPTFIAFHNDTGTQMMVTGVVETFPDVRDAFTTLRLEVETMHPAKSLDYTDVDGLVLVRTDPGKTFHYGDRVVVRGYLETPSESEAFSYRNYLARQGIYTSMQGAKVSLLENDQGKWFKTAIYKLKEGALGLTYRLWPDPEASLFAGILLGVEAGIPEPVQAAFKETGTSHIIVISGFNIAIVSGLFARMFGRLLGLYKGALVALLAIAIYTLLVGGDAAVIRAAIMGGLTLFAGLIGRRQVGYHALGVTATVMALFDPHVLWDVGFQLSFAATLGLALYADPLADAFTRLATRWLPDERAKSLSGPVGEFFLFTFAAQLTTLPIMAYHFETISWSAFLANPVILPFQPPIMILGGLSLILGLVWFPLGKLVAFTAWPFVLFTIRAVEFFDDHTQGALVLGDFSLLWLVLYYVLLLGLTLGWARLRAWVEAEEGRFQSVILVPTTIALGVAAVMVCRGAMSAPDGQLHLTLLDVGTGDAVLICTPEGRYVLVNGGPSTSRLADGLGRRLPPFQRELDWLVVASAQSEQIAGLARIVDRYPPSSVLWAGFQSPSRSADYLRERLTRHQIPITSAVVGHSLNLGVGANLKVLAAGNRGAILLLEWDDFRALLPLGINDVDLDLLRMGENIGPVNVLLLAENGYAPANPAPWVENLDPQLVMLSVAPDDRDGLPDSETLENLGGRTLLRTDQQGWIQISTDGKRMWVVAKE